LIWNWNFGIVFPYQKEDGTVGTSFQKVKKIVKRGGEIEITDVLPVRFVPMTGEGLRQKTGSGE